MNSFFRNFRFEILVLVLASLTVGFLFYPMLFEANQYTFSQTGDGIKNYYTFMQHAMNDSHFWTFESMNYPYTENIVFTDAQPVLSYIVGLLGLGAYSIGIMNLLMIFSIVLGALFLFKILTHYQVSKLWALFSSIGIALLSPQIIRFTGHYSLSYVCAIPMIWYLIIRLQSTQKKSSIIIASISILALFFIHPYLGLICGLFSLAYFFLLLFKKSESTKKNALLLFLLGLLPIILFQFLIILTDSHVDRQTNEHMFYHYYATPGSILAPFTGPMTAFNVYFDLEGVSWETRAYLGTGALLLFVSILLWFIFQPTKFRTNLRFLDNRLWLIFLAAFLVLLFSFCVPMRFPSFRWITELVPSLTQFRVLGRFSWIFYYVFAVFSVIFFFRIYSHSKFKLLFGWIFTIAMIFTFIEGYYNVTTVSNTPTKFNPFLTENIAPPTQEVIQILEEYDAFMFLPFTHLSSEKIFIKGSESSLLNSFVISVKSNKPMVNTISSRVSLSEAKKVREIFGPSYCKKDFFLDLPKNGKVLIIHDRSVLIPEEQQLIDFCEKVSENNQYITYELNTNRVFDIQKRANILTHKDAPTTWISDSTNVLYIYDDFDSSQQKGMLGKGALHGTKKLYESVKKINKEDLPPGNYEVSFWYNISVDRPDVLAVIETKTSKNGPVKWFSSSPRYSSHFIDDWAFTAIPFTYTDQMDGFELLFTGNDSKRPYEIDHLLIRNTDSGDLYRTVRQKNGLSYLVYNNRYLRLE